MNLSLDVTEEERSKSLELEVGFDERERTWEVIVKYSGDLTELSMRYPMMQITELSNEYAIIVLPENLIDTLTSQVEIEYMEKPKRLFFAVEQGIRASCITPVYGPRYGLTGQNVLIAFIDSGIDYMHPDFRNADGSSRILAIWDQTIPGAPPVGFVQGTEYDRARIDEALAQGSAQEAYQICPTRDLSGHGTHVAGIAAGNGRGSTGGNRGVAFESSLLVVKLGTPREASFPRTTELMQAVDYSIRKASALRMPLVINISFGNNYGSHDGSSLLETYLSDISNYWKSVLVIGTGNEGAARGHTEGVLNMGENRNVEFAIGTYETSINVQIWKSYADEMAVSIIHPNGKRVGPIQQLQGTQRFRIENTQILVYYGEPSPYSASQEIYLDFIPEKEYIDGGIWQVELVPIHLVTGTYNMWLPSSAVLNESTGFLYPSEKITLTIPSTTAKAIAVGAYDSFYNQLAAFSGRGYTRQVNLVKPDICAPGVNIESAAPGGGYTVRSGTSMATPFVAGAAALLMEWGIVQGNDPYLYGEKLKAYLIKGAKHLPGYTAWPNPQMGDCVKLVLG